MSENNTDNKIDIEKTLRDGQTVQINPIGGSMLPLFVTPEDQAVITPDFKKIKRRDVMVYRRPGGPLVIHRVVKVKPEGIYMVGDRQQEVEGPLPVECMLGKMVSFVRKGKKYTTKNLLYKAYSWIWMLVLPQRFRIVKLFRIITKPFTKKTIK